MICSLWSKACLNEEILEWTSHDFLTKGKWELINELIPIKLMIKDFCRKLWKAIRALKSLLSELVERILQWILC